MFSIHFKTSLPVRLHQLHVAKYKQAGSGWKRFVGRDGGMELKNVAGSGMDKAYVRPSVKGSSLACDERVRKILAHTQDLEDT